ncbi:MAG: hypothetical protein IJN53_07170 [Oscillospiraceae bacterium]|nr:hypothetical protein [Oscillospiraceae bacterium]
MDYSITKQLTTPLLFTHKGPIHTSSAFAVGTPVLGCPKPIIDIRSNTDTAGAVSLRIFSAPDNDAARFTRNGAMFAQKH